MEVTRRGDGVTVVNDAYNANPESMRAALAATAAMDVTGRRWAVLGSMLELGADSDAEHARVGESAVVSGVDELLVVGGVAAPMAAAAGARATSEGRGTRVRSVPDAEAAEAVLRAELRPGDLVLLKSSRDAGLRWLGERVAAGGGGAA
jgi:UDP-N-acetylmuramoyl-tripeptide--D-alanyl-D-alanine ligase